MECQDCGSENTTSKTDECQDCGAMIEVTECLDCGYTQPDVDHECAEEEA